MTRTIASHVTTAVLIAIAAAACGGSSAGPSGDLHFPVSLDAVQYTPTVTGCTGSGTAVALQPGADLLVVDARSRPVEHVRLAEGAVHDGRCRFTFQVRMPARVPQLWLATGGGSSRTALLAERRNVQRDGQGISLTFAPRHE